MNQDLIDFLRDRTVLYVEDDENVKNAVKGYLSIIFKEIYVAENGEEAYEAYQKHKPDVVLTDIDMPKLNGIELTKLIRKNDRETPIIIMTAHKNPEYLMEVIELNLTKYILKPFNGDELLSALNKVFELSKDESLVDIYLDCKYDRTNKCVIGNDSSEYLTEKESQLLELLIKARGNLVSYEEIEQRIWYDTYMTQETLRALVKNLRKKIPKEVIETVTGHGYKIKKI